MGRVVLKEVSKVYAEGVRAVDRVSLDVQDGEFVVLVGPSGCGKTTTLRMVAGLESASEGTIELSGRSMNGVHPKDRDIAMVFQNYALYPHMTVYGNMAFALKLRHLTRAEIDRRVRSAASILGIGSLLGRKPRALSGGQRQRVAVGRALVREPQAFLFDEPLSNLDATLRVTTRAELKALHMRLRTTTLYVTHDQEEAMTLGDRVVVMCSGRVQQAGAPLDVYRRPSNRFVASFVGTPAMNFVEGALVPESGAMWFHGDPSSDGTKALRLRVRGGLENEARVGVHARAVLGLRPQAIRAVGDNGTADRAGREGCLFRGTVRVIEPLGDSLDVVVELPGAVMMTARVPAGERVIAGKEHDFAADMDRAHYFEIGEFGRNLAGV